MPITNTNQGEEVNDQLDVQVHLAVNHIRQLYRDACHRLGLTPKGANNG